MGKYPRYQDYVIKDGKLVGEFEQLYRDHDDPWEQSIREEAASEKLVALEIIRRQEFCRVIELGCGLGGFTKKLAEVAGIALGTDISQTAVEKARGRVPGASFQCADVLDLDVYRQFRPDCIVLSEITWYVLEQLHQFKDFLRKEMSGCGFLHLLMTYRDGEQKYGKEYFTNLDEIMAYWNCVEFSEWVRLDVPSIQVVNAHIVLERLNEPRNDIRTACIHERHFCCRGIGEDIYLRLRADVRRHGVRDDTIV